MASQSDLKKQRQEEFKRDPLSFFKKVGSIGGVKRARKYNKKQRSKWAHTGGRPANFCKTCKEKFSKCRCKDREKLPIYCKTCQKLVSKCQCKPQKQAAA